MKEENNMNVSDLITRIHAGDVEARRLLALCYLRGEGIPARYTQAMEDFELAALLGDVESAYWLASLYVAYQEKSHLGNARAKAMAWFARAGEEGLPLASYRAFLAAPLGERSEAQRLTWLERAAEAGLRVAAEEAAFHWLYHTEAGHDPTDVIRKAFAWHLRALTPGAMRRYRQDIPAEDLLWPMVEGPDGLLFPNPSAMMTPPEPASLLECAHQGDSKACYALGLMSIAGIGKTVSLEEGVHWLQKAAESLPAAQYAMGELHRRGVGVERSSHQAVAWFQKAAEQELCDAEFALGHAYEYGHGVERSLLQAKSYYYRAKEGGVPGAEEAWHRVARLLAWLNGRDFTSSACEERL